MEHKHEQIHAVVKVPEWSSMDKGDFVSVEHVFADYWKAITYRDTLIKTDSEFGVHDRYGVRTFEVFN